MALNTISVYDFKIYIFSSIHTTVYLPWKSGMSKNHAPELTFPRGSLHAASHFFC